MKLEFFHTMNYWGHHGDSWPSQYDRVRHRVG